MAIVNNHNINKTMDEETFLIKILVKVLKPTVYHNMHNVQVEAKIKVSHILRSEVQFETIEIL